MADPKERARIVDTRSKFDPEYGAIHIVANFFEDLGVFVKNGIIDRSLACDLWSYVIVRQWKALAPYITFLREDIQAASLWENFHTRDGDYPHGARRMPPDRSLCDAVKPSVQ